MPGNVASAAPASVMPFSLCTSYKRSDTYVVIENTYKNGENQRASRVTNPRAGWELAKRLTGAQLVALRTFYSSVNGPLGAFYFYDVWETSPLFHYDNTGAAVTGRYIARFVNQWAPSVDISRANVSLSLLEIL